jgi:hypothetical protein
MVHGARDSSLDRPRGREAFPPDVAPAGVDEQASADFKTICIAPEIVVYLQCSNDRAR